MSRYLLLGCIHLPRLLAQAHAQLPFSYFDPWSYTSTHCRAPDGANSISCPDESPVSSGSDVVVYRYDKPYPTSEGTPFRDGFFKYSCHPHPLEAHSEKLCIFLNPKVNQGQGIVVLARHSAFEAELERRLDFSSDQPASLSAIEVVAMPEKGGRGALATQNLSPGALVVRSRAVLLIPNDGRLGENPLWDAICRHAVDHLPFPTRAAIARLHGLGESEEQWIASVIRMNAFAAHFREKQISYLALTLEPSRFNHDCRPNMSYFIDPTTLEMNMKALRPIVAGEELTISYIRMEMIRKERQDLLMENYGFRCACEHCQMSDELAEKSDRRIKKLLETQAAFGDDDESVSIYDVEEAIALAQIEKLHFSLTTAYLMAAVVHNSYGAIPQVRNFAQKAMHNGLLLGDPDWMEREEVQQLLDDPQSHESSGSRLEIA